MAFFGRFKRIDDRSSHSTERHLARTLSWPHLIALGIGATIGTGIFTLTGIGAGMAGPSVILSFAVAGAIVICAALAYTEMATLIPTAGSAYTYTYTVLGEGIAWIVGWSLVLEYALAASAVATGWSAHIQGFLAEVLHFQLPKILTAGPFEGGSVNVMAVLISLVITALLSLGARESARINMILVAVKLFALGLFVVLAVPAIQNGNYTLVSARFGISNPGQNVAAEFYVDNLLDKVALTSATSNAILGGKTFVTSTGPRTIGIHLQKSF